MTILYLIISTISFVYLILYKNEIRNYRVKPDPFSLFVFIIWILIYFWICLEALPVATGYANEFMIL